MFRDLLVHVNGDERARHTIRLAVDLALRAKACLTGIHVRPPAVVSPLYKPSQVEAALAQSAAALATRAYRAKMIFQEETESRLPAARWFETAGDIAQNVGVRARFADLVILGRDDLQDPPENYVLPLAHAVVLHCGRPVLVTPDGAKSSGFARVAVAWDGSREAVRAVHDALPLLKLAQTVHLVTVIRPADLGGEGEVTHLVSHLANHGISVEAEIERTDGPEEHKALQRNIDKGGYDLVVMGGYSHPRWLEFVVGGATLFTLLTSDIPVLVSH